MTGLLKRQLLSKLGRYFIESLLWCVPISLWNLFGCLQLSDGSESLKDDSGEFSTPSYPNLYSNKAFIVWKITVDADRNGLVLTFQDFQLETSVNCTADFVMIWDGDNEESQLIGTVVWLNSCLFLFLLVLLLVLLFLFLNYSRLCMPSVMS